MKTRKYANSLCKDAWYNRVAFKCIENHSVNVRLFLNVSDISC